MTATFRARSRPASYWPNIGFGLGSPHMQNIRIVAWDSCLGTLRLRRNYGLRNPGNPLSPHRPPRSAAPIGAPYRERVLICKDAPGAARTRHDDFVEGAMTT